MVNLMALFKRKNKIAKVNDNAYELNIQPAASILNVFSRLSYKAWYAIAEFVDNSTQSYLSHKKIFNDLDGFEKLVVKVTYNEEENTLTIVDNAYGMELDKFQDAIILDSKNSDQEGRNEFGMGLKTAASWFGDVWSVTSTQLGSENEYSATVNIPKLKAEDLNSIPITRKTVSKNSHGTTVKIEQITKKITGPRTKGKIKDLLSSMYRRDIKKEKIEIWFNDEPIEFEDYPILQNFRDKKWKKQLSFDVEFEGRVRHVTGFVAIMNPGSFSKAGFALFRQNRVIIGGTDCNYKPTKIFGQAQSQVSLKLFGELNMNEFPVNQAKDGFVWDDGLEDAFIDALKENIQEYIVIADLSKKAREDEQQYTPDKSKELQADVRKTLEAIKADSRNKSDSIEGTEAKPDESDVQEYIDTVLNKPVEEKTLGTTRKYSVPVDNIHKAKINVTWTTGSNDYWIKYNEDSDDKTISVLINIGHPFFMPYSKDDEFKRILEKLVLAYVVSERQAEKISSKEGYILPATMRNFMNNYLSKLADGE